MKAEREVGEVREVRAERVYLFCKTNYSLKLDYCNFYSMWDKFLPRGKNLSHIDYKLQRW